MIQPTAAMYLILCPLIFLAAFVDAVAGGGGVISLPAYLLVGLPVHDVAGSNKFSAGMSGLSATIKYLRNGKVNIAVAAWSAAASFVGSLAGTRLALICPESLLKIIMLVALPLVAVVMAVFSDKMMHPRPRAYSKLKTAVLSLLIGFALGCYDGLIGPGTGTFLIMAFSMILGYDLLTASGCAKLSNLASNAGSMILYIIKGKVVYALAVPAALCGMLGAYAGARFAIKGGSKNVRYIMFVVLGLLFVKFAVDLF